MSSKNLRFPYILVLFLQATNSQQPRGKLYPPFPKIASMENMSVSGPRLASTTSDFLTFSLLHTKLQSMYLKEDNFNINRPVLFRVVWLYYIATPAFFLAEVLGGISFRVPYFLTAPALRYLYYAFCAACGLGCYFRPKKTYIIAFIETTFNVVLLFTGFFVAMYTRMDSIIAGDSEVLTMKWVIEFGITGFIWVISFYYGLWALRKNWKPRSDLEAEIKSVLLNNIRENGPE